MSFDDALVPDPSKETKLKKQDGKETLGGVSSRHDPPPWNVGDTLNDFVLERLLGSGSSGVVYRALDSKTNSRCALKLLKHGPPDDLLRNKLGFRRMMSLDHPNLMRVDRIYQLGSYIALAMEEVDGVTFGKAVRAYKHLDLDEAYDKLLSLMRQFASGLAMMHANGSIHRDIKPENLMVDQDGTGRLIDYGLVDSFDLDQATYSARGYLVGTPHYFAPEVLWSQRYLPAGDIFSLGLVMLDALRIVQRRSGQGNGASSDHGELQRSKNNEVADAKRIGAAIDDLSESVPSIIRNACKEMLARDPADRPTAMELARLGVDESPVTLWLREEPIVGRQSEQQEMVDWIDQIYDGDIGRLHLTGRSGIGKSRLVDEIVRYIESRNWGQVFRARCRVREDQSLQAFDQLCDAIANRYMRGDRERLELDPVSVAILQSVFPVLKNVLTSSMRLAPAGTNAERLDALEAAARLSEQLRRDGPLFLVIDDAQWADRDSLNVLDRLQSAFAGEGLGIITVSRDGDDPQRVPASRYISLQPLDPDDSFEILARAAERWSANVPTKVLEALAEATDGTPFRLRELADEFRVGGALAEINDSDDPAVTVRQIDRLWQKRAERLSSEAKQLLPYIVTAGGRVSTEQLGELTGLKDSVDAAISELARQRLITDEATGGDCIAVFHDRVADELINTLSEDVMRQAHHAWASLLARKDNPERWAARIAGHFFAAGQPGRAVAHAILAAEDAERRVAKTEAARWYAKVIDHTVDDEQRNQIRNAARCYREADFPMMAAEYYQRLVPLVGDEERIECQMLITTLLIRSGRANQVRTQLQELAKTLGLPRPKSSWRAQLACMFGAARLAMHGSNALLTRIAADESKANQTDDPASQQEPLKRQDRRRQRCAELCVSLARPMSMFDNLYAGELNISAALLLLKQGDPLQRAHVAIGQAVFDCYDKGHRRIRGEMRLQELRPHIARLNSARARGDLWAGTAFSHALACRWDQVTRPVQASMENYEEAAESHGFDVAHTRWLDLWAHWNLGRWSSMQRISDAMFDDATRRSDFFQQIITASGIGSGTWLARDKVEEWRHIRARNAKSECDLSRTQMFHVFDWIAMIQSLIYEGQFSEAWGTYEPMCPKLTRLPYSRLQMIRVIRYSLGTLLALHRLTETNAPIWISRVRKSTHRLRQEQISFARVLANLYEGLLQHHLGRTDGTQETVERARQLLLTARDEARDRRLRPYQLAAEDALAEIHTGKSMGLLGDRMRSQNIARPECMRRLYTMLPE